MSEITNWTEVSMHIQQLPDKIKAQAMDILSRNAELIAGLAQIRVRVDTGNLRDSIHVEKSSDNVVIKAGGATAPYAPQIEAKYPFLEPSVAQVLPQIVEQLKGIQEEINNVSAK